MNPIYQYGDLVYYQTATMKVIGSYHKLDRWYYDMYCKADGCIYTSVAKYIVLKERNYVEPAHVNPLHVTNNQT